SRMRVPEGCWNMPRTLENTCLQTNAAEEFSGSSSHLETWGTEGIGRAGAAAFSGPSEAAGAFAVSRELQARADRSVITASTDARMERLPTATDVKEEDCPSATRRPPRQLEHTTALQQAIDGGLCTGPNGPNWSCRLRGPR